MNDNFLQISLLYELSLTNLRHFKPEENARMFVRKLLSRKALNSGAIWLYDRMDESGFVCKKLYAMPDQGTFSKLNADSLSKLFIEDDIALTDISIFESDSRQGYFAYFKLSDIGLLELYSNQQDKLTKKSIYPLKDVVNQLAVSIEGGHSYQQLQDEIKQRKQAVNLLEANEKKYRSIIDNINLGLLEVDHNEVITFANKSFQDLLHYSLEELIGKKASELLIDKEDENSHKTVEKENLSRKSGISNSYELQVKDKFGNKKWAIVSGAPNYDEEGNLIGSIGIHLDITTQKKLADENAFKDARIKKLFDISLDALISIDHKGEIFEWSPQAERIFGYSKEEITGMKLSETIIPFQHRHAHDIGMDNYLDTGHGPVLNKRIEITALRKSGQEFPIELTIFPLTFHGQHFFTAFVRDITELKESRVNMEKALERQKELNELRSKFISMTSHELRTPLTTIRANTEIANYLLTETSEIDKVKLLKNINRIEDNVERLNQLISNILTIGKLEANKVDYHPESKDADKIIREDILPNLPENKTPKLISNGEKFNLMIDDKLFSHIVNNLIENAFKYSPGKQLPELHLEYKEAGLEIRMKDYGIGIPKEDQHQLFDTFYRASNVDNIQGTGLGLTIVKECVELHNGKISIESDINKGTIFIIFLPK